MSDGLPTEEQLRRIERQVMGRIHRRSALPKRIATGAAVAALFAGGVFLLPRLGLSSGGSGSSSGGSLYQSDGRSAAAGSAGPLAECHGSPSATSPVRRVSLAEDTPRAALKACLIAYEKGQVPKPPPESGSAGSHLRRRLTTKDLAACRDAAGRLHVFVVDAHPSTLCSRNGMKAP